MSAQIQGRYHGKGEPLFWLYIKTDLLTMVTLGIYRFWAKTRIRKYIWSATSANEDSFEYTGTGLEKFLGFLVAIVILAIYLGIVQMVLFFAGLNLFMDPETASGADIVRQVAAIYITLFAVMPLLLFAQYRARRYKMARTRWRGIRFGMENAAWGYVWRAIGHYFLTLITLGILAPRASFYLEKYMTDRTWYGDARFEQDGKWTALYPAMKHLFIGAGFIIVGVALAALFEAIVAAILLSIVGYIWMIVGAVYYRVQAFNYLTAHKVLDDKIGFYSEVKTSTVIFTYIVWILIIGAVSSIAFTALFVVGFVGAFVTGMSFEASLSGSMVGAVALAIFGVVGYIAILLTLGALSLVIIVQPIIAHLVDGVQVHGAEHLDDITQRSADLGADAEGFADALDIGGAI
jgi:uncharacterized membrane protein YjgN (DUF898 family)